MTNKSRLTCSFLDPFSTSTPPIISWARPVRHFDTGVAIVKYRLRRIENVWTNERAILLQANKHDLVLAVTIDCKHFSTVFVEDAAHVVGDGLQYWNWPACDVHASKDHGRLGNSRESLHRLSWDQVVQLQVNVIPFGFAAVALTDLFRHLDTTSRVARSLVKKA